MNESASALGVEHSRRDARGQLQQDVDFHPPNGVTGTWRVQQRDRRATAVLRHTTTYATVTLQVS